IAPSTLFKRVKEYRSGRRVGQGPKCESEGGAEGLNVALARFCDKHQIIDLAGLSIENKGISWPNKAVSEEKWSQNGAKRSKNGAMLGRERKLQTWPDVAPILGRL